MKSGAGAGSSAPAQDASASIICAPDSRASQKVVCVRLWRSRTVHCSKAVSTPAAKGLHTGRSGSTNIGFQQTVPSLQAACWILSIGPATSARVLTGCSRPCFQQTRRCMRTATARLRSMHHHRYGRRKPLLPARAPAHHCTNPRHVCGSERLSDSGCIAVMVRPSCTAGKARSSRNPLSAVSCRLTMK